MFGFPPLKRPFHKTATDADLGRATRSVTLPSGRTYRLTTVQPDTSNECRGCTIPLTEDADEQRHKLCPDCMEAEAENLAEQYIDGRGL